MKEVKIMTKETTTITISKTNKDRISSILKHNEPYDFGISLLLLVFAKPRFGDGGILGSGRTVSPPLSMHEIDDIVKILMPTPPSNVQSRES